MSGSRIEALRGMVERFPDDPRARYFLGHELFKAEDWAGAAEQFATYLRLSPDDEGAGWRSLGLCLERTADPEGAAAAYRRGIDAALAHHHDGMASEIRLLLESLES